jgi:hypothetical protein
MAAPKQSLAPCGVRIDSNSAAAHAVLGTTMGDLLLLGEK